MTKPEMIAAVAADHGISKALAGRVLDSMTHLMAREIRRGKFVLPDIGIFTLVKRSARVARNPQTGGPVNVPARLDVKFKLAAEMKRRLNP